jgi:hypothetical protein
MLKQISVVENTDLRDRVKEPDITGCKWSFEIYTGETKKANNSTPFQFYSLYKL